MLATGPTWTIGGEKCLTLDVYITHDWFADISDVRMDRKQRLDENNDSVPARNVIFELAYNNCQTLWRPPDPFEYEFELVDTANQVELEYSVWEFSERTLNFDSCFINTDVDDVA